MAENLLGLLMVIQDISLPLSFQYQVEDQATPQSYLYCGHISEGYGRLQFSNLEAKIV